MNRRSFLQRGGALLGATALPWASGIDASAAATGPGFTAARRQTYALLVEAVGAAPDNPIDPSRADEAADIFARRYEGYLDYIRDLIDRVLDALEMDDDDERFSGMTQKRRLARLRSWTKGATDKDRPLRVFVAVEAVQLAAQWLYPSDIDFRPPPMILR
jgi:hypothetical protein